MKLAHIFASPKTETSFNQPVLYSIVRELEKNLSCIAYKRQPLVACNCVQQMPFEKQE